MGCPGPAQEPLAGVGRVDHGMPAPSVRWCMRRPGPFRPSAPPAPPPVPGGTGASDGAVRPRHHPACLGEPEEARWHRGERAIGLSALPPPLGGTLGGPLGATRKITPAAAGHEAQAPRVDDLTKGGMWQATTPLRRLWRKQRSQELPLQVASPREGSSHGALLKPLRAPWLENHLSGIDS
jgi:hypothetical protein